MLFDDRDSKKIETNTRKEVKQVSLEVVELAREPKKLCEAIESIEDLPNETGKLTALHFIVDRLCCDDAKSHLPNAFEHMRKIKDHCFQRDIPTSFSSHLLTEKESEEYKKILEKKPQSGTWGEKPEADLLKFLRDHPSIVRVYGFPLLFLKVRTENAISRPHSGRSAAASAR